MNTFIIRPARAAALLGALSLAGCGGGPRPYPVTGVVVYEGGEPVAGMAGGTVLFRAPDGKSSASGDIDALGRFALSYVGHNDGALPGTYAVALGPPDGGEGGRPASPVGPEYRNPATTPLSVTVEPRANEVTLTVARPRPGQAAAPPRRAE